MDMEIVNSQGEAKPGGESVNESQCAADGIEVTDTGRSMWIQCDDPTCGKWRRIDHVSDPENLTDGFWNCMMNSDPRRNHCEASQESGVTEDDDEVIYSSYNPGMLVWAKVPGYPWWPGLIEVGPDWDSHYYITRKGDKNVPHFHVTFFGEKVSRAWVADGLIKNLSASDNFKAMGSLTMRGTNFTSEVSQAFKDAKRSLQLTKQERLEKFNFTKRYKDNNVREVKEHKRIETAENEDNDKESQENSSPKGKKCSPGSKKPSRSEQSEKQAKKKGKRDTSLSHDKGKKRLNDEGSLVTSTEEEKQSKENAVKTQPGKVGKCKNGRMVVMGKGKKKQRLSLNGETDDCSPRKSCPSAAEEHSLATVSDTKIESNPSIVEEIKSKPSPESNSSKELTEGLVSPTEEKLMSEYKSVIDSESIMETTLTNSLEETLTNINTSTTEGTSPFNTPTFERKADEIISPIHSSDKSLPNSHSDLKISSKKKSKCKAGSVEKSGEKPSTKPRKKQKNTPVKGNENCATKKTANKEDIKSPPLKDLPKLEKPCLPVVDVAEILQEKETTQPNIVASRKKGFSCPLKRKSLKNSLEQKFAERLSEKSDEITSKGVQELLFDADSLRHSTYALDISSNGKCVNCLEFEERIKSLTARLHPIYDAVPPEIWDIFPHSGQYVASVLKFAGFETIEAILSLEKEGEVDKVFQYVQDHIDIIDEAEKSEVLGIFTKNPSKLGLLPGLRPVMKRFIESVKSFKQSNSSPVVCTKQNATKRKPLPSASSPLKRETIESLKEKLVFKTEECA